MIRVLQNEKEIFYGEVREITDNIDFTKHIYAVGELAFLFDSIQPQKVYQCSPLQMFTEIINIHNSQVEQKKQFKVGEVSVTDANDYVYHFTNREDTLTVLRDKLCTPLNGYLKITKVNGERYINLVPIERYGKHCTQEIQFGENLLDYSANSTSVNIATSVIPIGAMIEEENRTSKAVKGLDEYVTIVGTAVDDYHKNTDDDYVINDAAVSQFGHIRVTKEWPDVNSPEILREKATEWIKQTQFADLILNVSAFDRNLSDINIDSFDLGDIVSVWAVPFGMESVTFPVQKKTIYMNDITKNYIVLGNKFQKSYTSQASTAVEKIKEEIPEISPLLKQAKDTAMAMLTDPSKGYVSYIFDEDGNRTEIWISDNMNSSKATRKWVWNSSGLGYFYKENDVWKTNVAITMDGAIVADRITTGTMLADRIKGGLLEVGGTGFAKDGIISVKNNKDSIIVTLDVNGLKMNSGSINLNNKFSVNSNGYMTSTSGKIGGFKIETDNLSTGDATLRKDRIGCGSAGYGIVNIVGDRSSDNARFGYIQLSNSGNPDTCLDGIRIYGNGLVRKYGGDGNVEWERWLVNIPES